MYALQKIIESVNGLLDALPTVLAGDFVAV